MFVRRRKYFASYEFQNIPVKLSGHKGKKTTINKCLIMTGLKKKLLIIVFSLICFVLWFWCILAIRFSGMPETLAFIACTIFGASVPLAFIFIPNRKRTAYIVIGLYILIFIGWSQIEPSHHREWVPSVAKLPYAKIEGDQAKIYNIRNFDYRTENDFSIRYYDRIYDLNDLESVDYILSYWDGLEAVAHTIFSFGFGDNEYIAVSVETRLEKGEPQSALRGLFKQYEQIYVLGDERDLIRLRTNFRKEDVYLYPTLVKKDDIRKLFEVILDRVNKIAGKPAFYNTLSQNCLSSLVADFKKVITPRSLFDFRRIANGYSDEMLFENGWIDSRLSFEETKRFHYINQYVKSDTVGDSYSIKIRPFIAR
jgi:hypothetical protein